MKYVYFAVSYQFTSQPMIVLPKRFYSLSFFYFSLKFRLILYVNSVLIHICVLSQTILSIHWMAFMLLKTWIYFWVDSSTLYNLCYITITYHDVSKSTQIKLYYLMMITRRRNFRIIMNLEKNLVITETLQLYFNRRNCEIGTKVSEEIKHWMRCEYHK